MVKGGEGDSDQEEEGAKMPGAVAETRLYGLWQTEEWEVPVAMDGLVPKNEHGNVHCPPLASSLPVGTVHLQVRSS